ncbi:hypothetical protein BGW38_005940 [Lunasporangiospora selenospora]|uniref:Uncharacterized protein n=1 Tax=Lunasporangiospora selenospora TaxID=979761 RepID=A0A9P6KB52_9FUNG|nr:hypothetical protein BGW38_005940 [Lunasporangiospora selenospora]
MKAEFRNNMSVWRIVFAGLLFAALVSVVSAAPTIPKAETEDAGCNNDACNALCEIINGKPGHCADEHNCACG